MNTPEAAKKKLVKILYRFTQDNAKIIAKLESEKQEELLYKVAEIILNKEGVDNAKFGHEFYELREIFGEELDFRRTSRCDPF
jgi:hypothetical protein